MKKLLCLALSLIMCVAVFAGCGKFDMENAELDSYVKLGDITEFSYNDLVEYYEQYRAELGANTKTFYATTGYTIDFDVTAELQNDDGTTSPISDWTKTVESHEVYRYSKNVLFDYALAYSVESAAQTTQTPRLIRLGEAFSFTVPVGKDYENADLAGKTVKLTVNVKKVLPAVYTDTYITEDLQEFYNTYSNTKKVIEMGDSVKIDFSGKIDGEVINQTIGTDFVFVVGKGGFVDGFESQLVGHTKGESFDITVTFPADYDDETLAGQDVVFTIKVDDVVNDSAIITENTPFADLWELKYFYRVKCYINYALVDFVADHSELIELPEALVDDFRDIYEGYVKRNISEQIAYYAENGVTYTKAEMKEMLYPDGSDVTYVEESAKDAAFQYIVVHMLQKELGIEYSEKRYTEDVEQIAAQYTSYYGETYTTKDIEKLVGEEVLRLSFLDALISEKLVSRVVDLPEFKTAE